jgi:hypothetical protein
MSQIAGYVSLAAVILGVLYLVFGPIMDDNQDDRDYRDLYADVAVIKEDVRWLTTTTTYVTGTLRYFVVSGWYKPA